MKTIFYESSGAGTKIFSIPLVLYLLILLPFNSCRKSDHDEIKLDENLIKSEKKYTSLLKNRSDENGTFEITNIKRNGNILSVGIKGGCRAEDYEIVWDGHILLSYPAQVNLVIYNRSPNTCGSDKEFNIDIDLTRIIEMPDSEQYVFHIQNGSIKKSLSLNPNGSVTSN